MDQTSGTPSSAILRLPEEILLKILAYTMSSKTPAHLEHILRMGRRFLNFRSGMDTIPSEREGLTDTELWFLLDPHQIEHFRDWLLINSTCRRFRRCGGKAFFEEKVFIIRPQFLKTLYGETAKGFSAENMRKYIHQVVVPVPLLHLKSQLITLPRFHALERLDHLSVQPHFHSFDLFSGLRSPALTSKPLPEELSSLLEDMGLRADQLEMQLLLRDDTEQYIFQGTYLVDQVYPVLRTFAVWRAKVRGARG